MRSMLEVGSEQLRFSVNDNKNLPLCLVKVSDSCYNDTNLRLLPECILMQFANGCCDHSAILQKAFFDCALA